MCCGTAVVGLDECGTKETAPEPYGTFVRVDIAGDADVKYAATLEALQKAISTQLSRGLTADEIRRYAVAHYDNAVMYRNYLEIYNGISQE